VSENKSLNQSEATIVDDFYFSTVQITGKHCSKKNLLFSTYLSSPELEKKKQKKKKLGFFRTNSLRFRFTLAESHILAASMMLPRTRGSHWRPGKGCCGPTPQGPRSRRD
jgi:hypothetical protein